MLQHQAEALSLSALLTTLQLLGNWFSAVGNWKTASALCSSVYYCYKHTWTLKYKPPLFYFVRRYQSAQSGITCACQNRLFFSFTLVPTVTDHHTHPFTQVASLLISEGTHKSYLQLHLKDTVQISGIQLFIATVQVDASTVVITATNNISFSPRRQSVISGFISGGQVREPHLSSTPTFAQHPQSAISAIN